MSISKAAAAKAAKHLSKLVRRDGVVKTRKEWIDHFCETGCRVVVAEVPDTAKRKRAASQVMVMKRGWVPWGNEKHPETIRFRQLERDAFEATKPEYRVFIDETTFYVLSKTEYDYSQQRSSKDA